VHILDRCPEGHFGDSFGVHFTPHFLEFYPGICTPALLKSLWMGVLGPFFDGILDLEVNRCRKLSRSCFLPLVLGLFCGSFLGIRVQKLLVYRRLIAPDVRF
jgi:hypothetical protein